MMCIADFSLTRACPLHPESHCCLTFGGVLQIWFKGVAPMVQCQIHCALKKGSLIVVMLRSPGAPVAYVCRVLRINVSSILSYNSSITLRTHTRAVLFRCVPLPSGKTTVRLPLLSRKRTGCRESRIDPLMGAPCHQEVLFWLPRGGRRREG